MSQRVREEPFTGFPEEALRFLEDLSRNNEKSWYQAHLQEFMNSIRRPSMLFTVALASALKHLAPGIAAEPDVGGSLLPLHRDPGSGEDLPPFETHVGIRLRDPVAYRRTGCLSPVFHIEFDATHLRLLVGIPAFDPRTIRAYRAILSDEKVSRKLESFIAGARAEGHEVVGDLHKHRPPGFAEGSDQELIRRKGLAFLQELPIPPEIHEKGFVNFCRNRFKRHAPLYRLLHEIYLDAHRVT